MHGICDSKFQMGFFKDNKGNLQKQWQYGMWISNVQTLEEILEWEANSWGREWGQWVLKVE